MEAKVVQEVRGLSEEVETVFSLRSLGDLCTQLQLRREEALRLGRLGGRVVFRVRVGRLEGGGNLVFTHWNVGIELKPNTLVAFPSRWVKHMVTPFKGFRNSLVFFTGNKMFYCGKYSEKWHQDIERIAASL